MPYGKGTYGTKRGRPPVKKKVKKYAVGGSVREPDKIKDLGPTKGTKRTKGERYVDVLAEDIWELKQQRRFATDAQKKEIDGYIAAKRAGIKANPPTKKVRTIKDLGPNKGTKRVTEDKELSVGHILAAKDYPDYVGKGVEYDTKSTIPTKPGTRMDYRSKAEKEITDVLSKERKREKKAGGAVKKMKHGGKVGKCPRDGIAIRGKTRG